eukprot:s903_g6.t1
MRGICNVSGLSGYQGADALAVRGVSATRPHDMNELAGGLYRGDRVLCNGRAGMVFGKPARAACVRISVSVMYEDGTVKDERVANLQLLEDMLEEEPREEEPPLPVQEDTAWGSKVVVNMPGTHMQLTAAGRLFQGVNLTTYLPILTDVAAEDRWQIVLPLWDALSRQFVASAHRAPSGKCVAVKSNPRKSSVFRQGELPVVQAAGVVPEYWELPKEFVPARAGRPVIPKIAGISRRPEPLDTVDPEPPAAEAEPDLSATLEAFRLLFYVVRKEVKLAMEAWLKGDVKVCGLCGADSPRCNDPGNGTLYDTAKFCGGLWNETEPHLSPEPYLEDHGTW